MINSNFKIQREKKISFLFKNKNKLSVKFNQILNEFRIKINDPKNILYIFNKYFKSNFDLKDLKKFKKFKSIAIIGMGGSILGIEAIYNFLKKKKIKKKIYFFDDLNDSKVFEFKKKKDFNKVLFIVISKSGNTLETLTNIYSLNLLKKKRNVLIITENKNNTLMNISKKFNFFYIEHRDYVGGRYSVLSETGIVPAYLMDIDILKLRSKFQKIFNKKYKNILKNNSIILSSLLNSKKYNNLIFLNYSQELEKFLYWLQQLIAESLGKKSKGFLPVISNVPKDHHSMLQLYLDGPKDKIFYIFSNNYKSKTKKTKKNLYSNSLGLVKDAQRKALIKTLYKNKIIYREFKIHNINEETLGELFTYFILETITVAKLSKVNPFDQPAVEILKVFTKEILK